MPVSISPDLPNLGSAERVHVPSAAWDQLIGAAWERGWDSADCPRGIEIAHLDPDEAQDLIDCYETARDEECAPDEYSPEWATDLPHPDELRSLTYGGGLRIEPCP